MLTEAEMKWLRERARETCERCKTHHLFCDYCNRIHKTRVWARDCFTLSGLSVETTYDELLETAEFEARVAAKMTRITVGDLPCGVDADNNECQKPHFGKYNNEERAIGCDMCFLMVARLAVEAEKGE